MPRVKYVGPHDAVDLVGVGTVAHGEEVEVSPAVAKSLDEQAATWQRVNTKTPAKSATKNSEPQSS
jgi:hypothetical protein